MPDISDDDYIPRNDQDDFDGNDDDVDKITNELNEDVTKELGVDPKEYKDEMNKFVTDETDDEFDSEREEIEDLDEDPEQE